MSAISPSVHQSINPAQRKWLLMTGLSVSAGLVAALSYWYSSSNQSTNQSSKKRRRPGKPSTKPDASADTVQREEVQLHGFSNIGNTCFMNCIVQALSSCNLFIEYLIDLRKFMIANGVTEPSAAQLANQSMNRYSHLSQDVSPLALVDEMVAVLKGRTKDIQPFYEHLINQSIKQFRGRDQQDAHELFVTMLDLLQLRANQAMNIGAEARRSQYAFDALLDWNNDDDTVSSLITRSFDRVPSLDRASSPTNTDSVSDGSVEADASSQSSVEADKVESSPDEAAVSTETVDQSCELVNQSALSVQPPSPLASYSAAFKFPIVTNGAESPCAPYISCDQSTNRPANQFPPVDPFTGLTANSLICQTCQYSSAIRHTPFNTLSVAIPYASGMMSVSLEQCLHVYCRREMINDFICALCSATETEKRCLQLIQEAEKELREAVASGIKPKARKVSKRVKVLSDQLISIRENIASLKQGLDADTLPTYESPLLQRIKARRAMVKQIMLARCPSLLCIHVNRLHGLEKLSTRVMFDELLDVLPMTAHPAAFYALDRMGDKPQLVDDRPHPVYRLTSVVVHHGASGAGHFTAYRRHARYVDAPGQSVNQARDADAWSHFSDDSVRPASWETVKRCEAYMLFYTKIT